MHTTEATRTFRDLIAVIGSAKQPTLASAVYGSFARGTDDARSDIDVIELVEASPRPYSRGKVNVTQYTPAHLHGMAQRGSLFVLHLITDSVPLSDPDGIFARSLSAYRPPPSYDPVWRQLATAAGILSPNASDARNHVDGLCRLGIYCIRTAVYLLAIEKGKPDFDVDSAASGIKIPRLNETLQWRRRSSFTIEDLGVIASVAREVIPDITTNKINSVLRYAVANSTTPDLDALFSAVLRSGSIEYSALSVPPF